MSELIEWNNGFSVGIDAIDADHRHLMGMLNALSDAAGRGDGESVIVLLLDGLSRYANGHFVTEERLMEKHAFPGLPRHRAEHEAFTARVLQFRAQFAAGDRELVAPMVEFLRDWLQGHILNTDKAYGAFLRSHGER